ncbi:unnamed protein product, partial [Brassica rapa subsp. narinosa]
ALQVWVYTALTELGRRRFKEAILSQLEDFPDDLIIIHIFYVLQTRVINFVEKDIGDMFRKWEFDVEDTPTENIIKLMFVVKENSPRPRKKARKEAPAEAPAEASEEAPAESSEEVHTVARSEVTMSVGGLTTEDIKTMFKDIDDAMSEGFGTCLKEIKYLSERVEAVEKKVGITTKRKGTSSQNRGTGTSSQNTTSLPKKMLEPGVKLKSCICFVSCMSEHVCFVYSSESVNGTNVGRKRLPEDKGPDVPADASSSKDKAPEPSLQSPYTANSTAKELADWLKTCPNFRTALNKKPRTSRTWSERMCFLDHLFAQQWRFNFKDFKDSEPDQNGLGRRLP